MKILDGKKIGSGILDEVRNSVSRDNLTPCLAVIRVGDDPASRVYVGLKEQAAARVGIAFRHIALPANTEEENIRGIILALNEDPRVHGIIVQLPLPESIRSATDRVIQSIDPNKDVDGFHPTNVKRFLEREQGIFPVFPQAIVMLARSAGEILEGLRAVVVCNSDLFGSVMREAFRREGVSETVIIIRSENDSMRDTLGEFDIVVTACGVPGLIGGSSVKPGAIVIDGGITELSNGKVSGDVDRESMMNSTGYLSPVPGGVGPVTVACLLANVVRAADSILGG